MFVRTAMSSLDRRIVLLLMFVLTCIPNSIFAQANEDTAEPEDTIVVPERREGSDTLEELTIVDDSKVDDLLTAVRKLDKRNEEVGIRAFVWNIEQSTL